MSSDPNHPDRPEHPDFYMLSDSVLTIESQVEQRLASGMDIAEARGGITAPFVDTESFDYMAIGRVHTIVAQLPFPTNMMLRQISELVAAIWQDGFAASLYYQERKSNGSLMVIPDTIEGLDGL